MNMTSQALEPISGDVIQYPAAPTTLFQSNEPADIVKRASAVASALAPVIENQKLYTMIQGKRHVQVGGWTLLGSMLGVFPITSWTRPIDGGFEARVEARTIAGQLVGAAEAQCTRTDWQNGKHATDNALRSMAQTRATSKALRLPLGFVVTLAGYDATPAEEMDGVVAVIDAREQARSRASQREAPAPPVRGVAGNEHARPETRPALPATEPQIKAIYAIGRGALSMDEETIDAACIQMFDGRAPIELTRREAAEFADAIKAGLPGITQSPEPIDAQSELISPDDLPFDTEPPADAPADAATLRRLLQAGEAVQMDTEAIKKFVKVKHGVDSPRKLTQQQAEALIAEWVAVAG
jgi:hypothetical protein